MKQAAPLGSKVSGIDGNRPSRLRIALGIHGLEPRGGLEDNCIRIAEALAARGHDVTIHAGAQAEGLDVPVVPLPSRARSNHGRAADFARRFLSATTGSADRTVTFQPAPGADILFLADWLRDRPGAPWWKRLTPRFRTFAALERGCFEPASRTRIIGLSRPQIAAIRARYGTPAERIAIAPPTMSPAMRRPDLRTAGTRARLRSDLDIPPDAKVWLWLGLQPSVKGLDRVLDALALSPDAVLTIGGLLAADPKAGPVAAQARALGVSDRLRWLGYLPPDRVLEAMAAADALAHPARLDITGGVILEALVNGLPVVATDICGFAEHVERSGGGLVVRGEPFEGKELLDALAAVTGPRNAAMSAAAIAYGARDELSSGIDVVCDLIEADDWSGVPDALRP